MASEGYFLSVVVAGKGKGGVKKKKKNERQEPAHFSRELKKRERASALINGDKTTGAHRWIRRSNFFPAILSENFINKGTNWTK